MDSSQINAVTDMIAVALTKLAGLDPDEPVSKVGSRIIPRWETYRGEAARHLTAYLVIRDALGNSDIFSSVSSHVTSGNEEKKDDI